MRAVVQRVKSAKVVINGRTVGKIEQGLLVFLGVGEGDSEKDCEYLANKIDPGIFEATLFATKRGGRLDREPIVNGLATGYTVTFTAIHLALIMGATEIVLIGCDFHFHNGYKYFCDTLPFVGALSSQKPTDAMSESFDCNGMWHPTQVGYLQMQKQREMTYTWLENHLTGDGMMEPK